MSFFKGSDVSTGKGAGTSADGEVTSKATGKGVDPDLNQTVKNAMGIGKGRNGGEVLGDSPEDLKVDAPPKNGISTDGSNQNVTDANGITSVYKDGKKIGTIGADGTITPSTPSEDAVDIEALAKFLHEHPALAKQIAASKSGGSGNIDYGNADNSTTSGPSNGMAPPAPGTTSRNLVGDPGARGGLGETGSGNGGLDFNNQNLGAITPTQDGNVTAGNNQQSEGEFFDRQQTRQNFPDGTSAPTNDSQKPPTDPSALTKFLRENPEIAKQIVASSLVQVPKAPVKKK